MVATTEAKAVVGIYRGLHQRPSGVVNRFCLRYPHDIRFYDDGRAVNPKRYSELVVADIQPGAEVTLTVSQEYPGHERLTFRLAEILRDEQGALRFEAEDRIPISIIGVNGYSAGRFPERLDSHLPVAIRSAASWRDFPEKKEALCRLGFEGVYYRLAGEEDLPDGVLNGVKLAYIASRPPAHFRQTLQTAGRGVLACTEKPLVPFPEEYAALLAADPAVIRNISPMDHYLWKAVSRAAVQAGLRVLQGREIRKVDAVFFEEAGKENLQGRDRLLSRESGGGVLIDTGIHHTAVLSKIFGLEFRDCTWAEAFDLFPERGYPCESGCHARYRARTAAGQQVNADFWIAKGTRASRKQIHIETDSGCLHLDYGRETITWTDPRERYILFDGRGSGENEHVTMLQEKLDDLRMDERSFTTEDAGRSLEPVYQGYARLGGLDQLPALMNRAPRAVAEFQEEGLAVGDHGA